MLPLVQGAHVFRFSRNTSKDAVCEVRPGGAKGKHVYGVVKRCECGRRNTLHHDLAASPLLAGCCYAYPLAGSLRLLSLGGRCNGRDLIQQDGLIQLQASCLDDAGLGAVGWIQPCGYLNHMMTAVLCCRTTP